jgi:hypothetical protein
VTRSQQSVSRPQPFGRDHRLGIELSLQENTTGGPKVEEQHPVVWRHPDAISTNAKFKARLFQNLKSGFL